MKVLILFSVLLVVLTQISITSGKNLICYFASWTVYRPGNGQFTVWDIDPFSCTHINFGFIGLYPTGKVFIIDPWESDDYGLGGFRNLTSLKKVNPNLKVLISMGGWNEGSGNYSIVAADPEKRQILIEDVLALIDEYGFDGFDLDWEYPGFRNGSNPDIDAGDFVELLSDLRAALNPRGYLLTAAVSGSPARIDVSYDVPAVSNLLDFINVMAYDFHGHFEPYVGHISPLYKSSLDTGGNVTLNVASGIEYWIAKGADPAKINLGVASYGRSFTLANPTNTHLYAPIKGGGIPGPYSRQEGFLGYNEICELHSNWTLYWDNEQQVPHRVGGDQWVGYENTRSIKLKVQYALSKNLGGIMYWVFDSDDFRGICGEKYPLLNAIKQNLK